MRSYLVKNKKALLVIAFILISIFYIFFSYYYFTVTKFNLQEQNLKGFSDEEIIERGGQNYHWTIGMEAVKKVKVIKNKIAFSIFTLKPDIQISPINVRISLNNIVAEEIKIKSSEVMPIIYKVDDLGFEIGEVIEIRFTIDKTWIPAEYGINDDTNELGVAVSKIKFLD